jgi:hypothetical protein
VPIRGDVSQISPPIRILLVLSIAVLGAYMLFLRPKTEVAPPAAPAPNTQTGAPAQTGAGKAVEAAQGAVKATNGQLQSEESVDGVDAGESAAGTKTEAGKPSANAAAATPAADLAGLPKPIAKAIRKHKVLVLLFWNGKSADDVAVHDALKKVDRWDGRVYVGSASIKKIAKYGRIARGVDVEQSPTVVVADPEMRAETLVGYVDAETIDQAVIDAFRNSTGLFTSAYLRKIDQVCAHASSKLWAIPDPDHASQVPAYLATGRNKWHKFEAAFKAVPAPKKFRALKRATVADNAAATAILGEWHAYLGERPGNAQLLASLNKFGPRWNAIAKRYNRRMDAEHVLACGSDA